MRPHVELKQMSIGPIPLSHRSGKRQD